MRLIGFAIYLGIGAMLHAMVLGPTFDWSSAWTFGWLFGWPLMLFIWFWAGILMIAVAIGLVCAVYAWLGVIGRWQARRKVRGQ